MQQLRIPRFLNAKSWHGNGEWSINQRYQALETYNETQNIYESPSNPFFFNEKGMATILIKQRYDQLFYEPQTKLKVPITNIDLNFYDSEGDYVIRIQIFNNLIKVWRQYNLSNDDNRAILNPIIFTASQNLLASPQQAPLMLRKKIWVQINKLQQKLRVSTGDVADFDEEKNLVINFGFDLNQKSRDTWQNQQENYPLPSYVGGPPNGQSRKFNPREKNILGTVACVNIVVKIQNSITEKINQKELINYLEFKCMNLIRNLESAVSFEPSILNPRTATLELLPRTINTLYGYLKNVNVKKLPDYKAKPDKLAQRQIYLSWKDLQSAIHYSLTTPYGYRQIKIESKQSKEQKSKGQTLLRPYGILNHLFKLKNEGKEYKHLVFNHHNQRPIIPNEQNNSQFPYDRQQFNSSKAMMDYIYNNRQGYVRLQLLGHQGLAPGSMAVLEVWPPYYCSPIHNHGEGYGLIKVLAGQIRVQNYSDLSFKEIDNPSPFQVKNYSQDEYTWLSEESFGIHRLVNMNNQTCLNLQAYYYQNQTNQFFTFVERNQQMDNRLEFAEFYPQNDWRNYLNIPKEQRAKQNDDTSYMSKYRQEDIKFIEDVIETYKLRIEGPDPNHDFYKLALIMRDEYEFAKNLDLLSQKKSTQLFTSSIAARRTVVYVITSKNQQRPQFPLDLNHIEVKQIDKHQLQRLLADKAEWKNFENQITIFYYNLLKINIAGNNSTGEKPDGNGNNLIINFSFGIDYMLRLKNTYGFPESLQAIYFQEQSQHRFETLSPQMFYTSNLATLKDKVQQYIARRQ